MTNSRKIFALEGEWATRLKHKKTVLPALQFLEQSGGIEFVHRRVAVKAAFFDYLELALTKSMQKYAIIYLGGHGDPGHLYLKSEYVSLEEIAELYSDRFAGKIIHFGSCSTINVNQSVIQSFLKKTKAELVSGYLGEVDFVESMLLDMAYFYTLQEDIQDNFNSEMRKRFPGLCKRLKFVIHRLKE